MERRLLCRPTLCACVCALCERQVGLIRARRFNAAVGLQRCFCCCSCSSPWNGDSRRRPRTPICTNIHTMSLLFMEIMRCWKRGNHLLIDMDECGCVFSACFNAITYFSVTMQKENIYKIKNRVKLRYLASILIFWKHMYRPSHIMLCITKITRDYVEGTESWLNLLHLYGLGSKGFEWLFGLWVFLSLNCVGLLIKLSWGM